MNTAPKVKIMDTGTMFYDIGDGNDRFCLVPTVTKNAKADAEFIVKACNNHDKLVEALKNIRRGLGQDIKIHDNTFGDGTFIRDKDIKEYIDSITDVLDFK